jgi:hypothetical protein
MAEGSPEHSKYYEVSPLSRSRPALVKPRRDLLSILIEEARQRLPQRPVTHLYVVTRLGPSEAPRGKWSIVSSAEQVPQSTYRRGPLPARRAVLTMAIRTDAIPTVAYAYRGYTHCGEKYCGETYCGYAYCGYTYCGYTHCGYLYQPSARRQVQRGSWRGRSCLGLGLGVGVGVGVGLGLGLE